MSSLVIEWDRDRLIVVDGSVSGRSVAIRHALTVPREPDQTAVSLGSHLQTALAGSSVSATDAIVVLPRSLVTLRRIQLPNVPNDELPDMVRLQAATLLSVPIESVGLDFVSLPGGDEQRDVLLATAPAEMIAEIQVTMHLADLELAGVQVSSFGIAAAMAHANLLSSNSKHAEAVLLLRSDMIEFLLTRGHGVEFSHSGAGWSDSDAIERTVRSEVSRGRLSATESIGSHSIGQVTLVGASPHCDAVPDDVGRRLDNAAVRRLDPATSIVQGALPDDLTATDVLAAAGIIANQHKASVAAVDLVNPRRPVEKADTRRLKVLLTVGVAVLLAVGSWKWRDTRLQDLQQKTETIEQEVSSLKSDFKRGEDERDQDAAIQDWSSHNVDWLKEMDHVRELMEGTSKLLIRNFTMTAGRDNYRGTIKAECLGRDRSSIEAFQQRLDAAGYNVIPRTIEPGGRDSDYVFTFPLEIMIPIEEPG